MKTYSIQTTSYLSGVSPDCIRAWERRYGAITPHRDKGRRVFSDVDVARLVMLKELSSFGNPISTVAKLSDEELAKLCSELGLTLTQNNSSVIPDKNPIESLEIILLALQAGRFEILAYEVNKAADEFNCRDFSLNIMLPILERMSSAFDEQNVPAFKRTALTGILKSIMLRKMNQSRRGDKQIVISFLPGKNNEFKSLLGALVATHTGFNAVYVDQCSDAEALIEAARLCKANAVVIETSAESFGHLSFFKERAELAGWKGEIIISGANSKNFLTQLEDKLKTL